MKEGNAQLQEAKRTPPAGTKHVYPRKSISVDLRMWGRDPAEGLLAVLGISTSISMCLLPALPPFEHWLSWQYNLAKLLNYFSSCI